MFKISCAELTCNIVCESIYYPNDRVEWHKPVNKEAKIVVKTIKEGDVEVPITKVVMDGKSDPVIGIRSGMEGRVVTLIVRGTDGNSRALYTDILTPGAEKDTSDFLERYGRGDRHSR